MKRHIKIVAVFYIVIGGLGAVAALIVFGMLGGMPDFSTPRNDHQAAIIVLLLPNSRAILSKISAPISVRTETTEVNWLEV